MTMDSSSADSALGFDALTSDDSFSASALESIAPRPGHLLSDAASDDPLMQLISRLEHGASEQTSVLAKTRTLLALAELRARAGDAIGAERDAVAASGLSQKHSAGALSLARHCQGGDEILAQLEVISRIAEHDASRIHAGLRLAERLDERGESDRASEVLDQLAFAHPGEPRIALARLVSRLAAGRSIVGLSLPGGIEPAGSLVAELLGAKLLNTKRTSGSHPALSLLDGAQELALGHFANAKSLLDAAPGDDDARAELGAILLSVSKGREQEALGILSEIARRSPEPRHEHNVAALAVRLRRADVLDEVLARSGANPTSFSPLERLVLHCLAGKPLARFDAPNDFGASGSDDVNDAEPSSMNAELATLAVARGSLGPLFGGSLTSAPTDALLVELARLAGGPGAEVSVASRISALARELESRGTLPELARVLALLDAQASGDLAALGAALVALAELEDQPEGRARLLELAGLVHEASGDRALGLELHRHALDASPIAGVSAAALANLGGHDSTPSVPEGVLGAAARIAIASGNRDDSSSGGNGDSSSARQLRELVPGHVILEFVASLFELAERDRITRTITHAESTGARERSDAPARLQRIERALVVLQELLLDGTAGDGRHRAAAALAALSQEPVPPVGRRTALAVARHLSPLSARSAANASAPTPLECARLAAAHLLAAADPALGTSPVGGEAPSRDEHRAAAEQALRTLTSSVDGPAAARFAADRLLLEELEDRSSDSVRSSARWLERAQSGATEKERLLAFQRLATLEEWRGDERAALLFRRALLEEFPADVATLLALEGRALADGRPADAALLLTRILPQLTSEEAPAYRGFAGALALARYDFTRAESLLPPEPQPTASGEPHAAAGASPGVSLLARRISQLRAAEQGDARTFHSTLPDVASFAATDLDLFTVELERAAGSLSVGSHDDAAAALARARSVRSEDFLLAWLATEAEHAKSGAVSPSALENLARATKSPRLAARTWLAAGLAHAQGIPDQEEGEHDASLGDALLMDADDIEPDEISADEVGPTLVEQDEVELEPEPETDDSSSYELAGDALGADPDEAATLGGSSSAEDPADATIRCYEASLAAEPSLAAFERLSQLLDERKDRVRLRAVLEDRLALLDGVGDPRGQLALELWLSRLLLELGEPRAAKEHLEAALTLAPESVDALRAHAEVSALLGDHASAEASLVSLRDSLPKGPERLSIVRSLGRIYLEHLSRPESAMDAFESVLAEEPEDLAVASTLVRTYGVLGLGERATTLQTALVQRFASAEEKRRGALYLAELYERLTKDPKRAAATLERTRRAWPLDADVLEHTAHFMDRQGEVGARRMMVDRVAKDARRKLMEERLDPALLDTLARAAHLSGRAAESRAITAARAAYLGADADEPSLAVLDGAGMRALESSLDGLLAPAAYPLPLRALLQKTGLAMDAAFPVDLSAMQARPLTEGPVPERLALLTRATGLGKVDLFVAPSLGHRALPLTSSPPRLVVGPHLASLGPRAMDFLLLRALKLLGQGAGALARSRPDDVWPMLVALLRLFAPQFRPGAVPGSSARPVDAKKVAQAQALMEQGLARVGYDEDVPTLALEVVGALNQRGDDLGPLPRLVANRAALLGTDLLAGLEAMSAGSPRLLPTRGPARYRWLAAHPDASDLLQFATTDEFVSARQRLGLDAGTSSLGGPPQPPGPQMSRRPKPAPPQRG